MAIQTDIVGRTALNRHAVGYARISTKEQNEKTQVQQLLAQGVPREHIFTDTAMSGTTPAPERPGFRALLEFVRDPIREVTTLYVFEISCVGRSFLETLDIVRGLEEECGVIVWSLSPKERGHRRLIVLSEI